MGELIGEEPRISHRWAGIFALTQDMLPLVGQVPGRDGLWVAAGYSGHGNVLGFACGELVADAILGDSAAPQLALFDPARFACLGASSASWMSFVIDSFASPKSITVFGL